jgi:DNA phosphorothioation-dependent restriction protein DptH
MSQEKEYIFDYISEVLMGYFGPAHISRGERYHIRYEQEKQVKEQFDALKETAIGLGYKVEPFIFNDYVSYSIRFNSYKLIVAASGDDVAVDFLTGLRNRVAESGKEPFDDAAILFIHHTSLDSIIGGCKSLADSGMPLNVLYIKENIKTRILSDTHFETYQKHILNYRINQIGEGNDDAYSLFNYAVFLQILGKKRIGSKNYLKLGLFPDKGLKTQDKAEAEKRLKKNEEWFDEVSNGHQYGGLDKILEKSFSQKGVDNLSEPDWSDYDFTELSNWNDEKNNTTNIVYLVSGTEKTDDYQVMWDRPEGTTLAKTRIRHIIVFNYDHRDKVNLTLNFDARPKKEGLGAKINLSENEYQLSGKKILLNLKLDNPSNISYKSLAYEHPGFSAKYVFNILVFPFREHLILGVKSSYLIKTSKAKIWHLELAVDDIITLNDGHTAQLIDAIKFGSEFTLKDDQTLKLKPELISADFEQEEIIFQIHYQDISIPIHIALEKEKPDYISGQQVRQIKIETGESFQYLSYTDPNTGKTSITLTHRTGKYYPKDEFRENLHLEKRMIDDGHLAYFQDYEKKLINNADFAVDTHVENAYRGIINYYRENNLLPSLAALTNELRNLYEDFVSIYINLLINLEEGQALSKSELDLLKLGTIEMLGGNKLLKFTPLHPLNIAYQLRLIEALGDNKIPTYLLEKLRPLNLVPYIKGRRKPHSGDHYYYQPVEQGNSAEWLYYFCDEVSSQQVSRHFVPELVDQKIEQFLKHFRFLFLNQQAILKINLFNQGDAKEILQGIFTYYARFFRKDKLNPEDALSIQVTLYESKNYMTKFEELTLCEDVRVIEEAFDFKFPSVSEPDELFDLYSRKVTFFKVDDVDTYEYAHLSFYQFSPAEVTKSANNMNEVPSGISLDGLMADVPSVFQRNSFRTGFGTGGININQNSLVTLSAGMNAFVKVTHTDDQFTKDNAIAFVINKDSNQTIEKVYAKSQWVTFIEPKVDLTFFKSYKEVVIIHYSDQYNNASGYDAITITSKWEPYKATILEVFNEHHVNTSNKSMIHVIDLFNAINGQWLLGMNSPSKNNTYFRIEKLSMLSAIKAALAIFDHDDITWVPISLEEILRISGAIGLKQTDGLFSVKNLGRDGTHNDDLLFVGLEEKLGKLNLYFLPLEVKIGNVDSNTFSKASEQSAHTAELFRKFLMDNNQLSGKIYRNFFAKLVLISADKFALYNIWPSYTQRWRSINNYRSRLLNDDFVISNNLDSSIGYYGVMAFKWSSEFMSRSINYENDSCTITFLKHDGLDFLTKDIDDLKNDFSAGNLDSITSSKLLRNRYPIEELAIAGSDKIIETLSPEDSPLNEPTSNVDSLTTVITNVSTVTSLSFNALTMADIERYFAAIYEKLTAIGIIIKKELIADINFMEGPAFFRIEIKPAPTTTMKKIRSSVDELNIALQLPEESSVRIFSDLGKIWLEAPKQDSKKIMVTTDHIWPLFRKNNDFQVPFGADIEGNVQSINFSSSNSPHLLLAGTTGSGKSVVLDTLIRGAMNFYTPEELQIFLVDPKGNELIDFEGLPHLPKPNGMTSAEAIDLLKDGVDEMDRRYNLFKDIRLTTGQAAKDLFEYNKMITSFEQSLPRWLIILDEYSDLLDEDAGNKAIIETQLKRLAQKARAAGIHIIVATQKPLVNIVSSAIKSNLPGVIALRVRTATDSRVILDDSGAETLAGKGDSLFKNGTGQMIRVQAAIHPR